ncbi:sepiapterin reductase-like [Schistocerca gregaria]|uniref:sepiapterin reductase-like n=1 Tax=Schistocerca gregaria TaxID=7010 RepID=UPI00211F2FD0|nr:sepiapterin reductase-like [Schistocerca gregaria]
MPELDTQIIVTGASRGIGKNVAVELSGVSHYGSKHFLISSTKLADLEETKECIIKNKNPNLPEPVVDVFPMDFSDIENLDKNIQQFLKPSKTYSRIILINNHGNADPIGLIHNFKFGTKEIKRALDLNVLSFIALTSAVLKNSLNRAEEVYVVNISSLGAIKPIPGWGVYCAGKAARDMFIQVLAAEVEMLKKESPGIKVKAINYAPGVVDTDAYRDAYQKTNELVNTELKFGKPLTASYTSKVLVDLLIRNEWESGSHIDIGDIVNISQ